MGWAFLRVKSAEGRHAPENAEITQEEYDAAVKIILDRMGETCLNIQ